MSDVRGYCRTLVDLESLGEDPYPSILRTSQRTFSFSTKRDPSWMSHLQRYKAERSSFRHGKSPVFLPKDHQAPKSDMKDVHRTHVPPSFPLVTLVLLNGSGVTSRRTSFGSLKEGTPRTKPSLRTPKKGQEGHDDHNYTGRSYSRT